MIRDPGARISIMARAAADAAHPTGRIYDRNRSPKRPLLTACTRAGSIYDTKRRRLRLHLPGGAFFWGEAEPFDEFDYFVCDVFFFAVDCDHVIALV